MYFEFKQAVHLVLAKKDFPKGVHFLSEAIQKDETFVQYKAAGLIVDAKKEVISGVSMQDRNKKLAEKILPKPEAHPDATDVKGMKERSLNSDESKEEKKGKNKPKE